MNKKDRKIYKYIKMSNRKYLKRMWNIDSIVVKGLPMTYWYHKYYNGEISKEEFIEYFYEAEDKIII